MPLPEYLDINDIDPGIRELILLMNEMPFIETISSCEGGVEAYRRHRERYGVKIVLREKNRVWVFKNGYVTFQTDGKPTCLPFLERVKELVRDYNFASLTNRRPMKEEDYSAGVAYGFKFPLGTGEEYSLELHGDDIAYGDLDTARKRKGEFDEVWKNFEELCREFIKN